MEKPKSILKSVGKSFNLSSKIGKNKKSRARFSKATGFPTNKFRCSMTKDPRCVVDDKLLRKYRRDRKKKWIIKRGKTPWLAAKKRLKKANEKKANEKKANEEKAENEYNNSWVGMIANKFSIIRGGKTQKKNKKHKKYTKKHKKYTKKHKKYTKKK
jgi:hypothetical protein